MPSWADNLSARAQSWAFLVRIEGIGTYDGQYVFCTARPAYADALYLPYIEGLPEIIAERVDLDGGVPRADGSLTVKLLDVDDLLTALIRTDRGPTTALEEDVDTSETSILVGSVANIAVNSVVWAGSEAFRVTGTGTGPDAITVTRGWLGTEALTALIGDPLYLSPPYFEGRRLTLSAVPITGSVIGDERVIGAYVIGSIGWDEAANIWEIQAVSQLAYLDRVVPREPRQAQVAASYWDPQNPSFLDLESNIFGPLFGAAGAELYAAKDGDAEVIGLQNALLAASNGPPPQSPRFYDVTRRNIFGTRRGDIQPQDTLRQVFLAGEDLRCSPGPSASTSRTSGTWTPAVHWVDLLLIVLLSSAEDADGLELTNVRGSGSDWSRSNFASLPAGYGVGLPVDLIDWDSFEEARARTRSLIFPRLIFGGKGQRFSDWVTENFLRPVGAFLRVESGTVSVVVPRMPLAEETAGVTLDSSNILTKNEGPNVALPRVTVSRAKASVAGGITYLIGPNKLEATFNNALYGRAYGQRGFYGQAAPSLEIPVPGGDPAFPEVYGARASSRLFRRHRPALEARIVASAEAWDATPGALVSVTCPGLVNMADPSRGWTNAVCEVQERQILADLQDGLTVNLSVRRYSQRTRIGRVAPAAYVESVSSNEATVATNRYTEPDAPGGLPTTDASAFTVGDILIRIDPDGAILGSAATETVVSISGDVIELTGDFSGALTAGDILTYALADDTSATQLARYAHAADRATQTVGSTTDPAFIFGEP